MAKKKQNKEKQNEEEEQIDNIKQEVMTEEKYPLIELVANCNEEPTWVIYNLSRKGLLGQYEQEIIDYGKKEIPSTLTIREFEEIIQGKQ